MKQTLKLIRVFLASPGDLTDERHLAKEAVEEINKQIAHYFGFSVELMGWEETLPGWGRPQDLINEDLDLCDLFIGVMWKRWGTPPATESSYSSGFEEEYRRSYLRQEKTKKPEIAMFFKKIDTEYLSDPGDDLKKVIEFKSRLVSEKKILYKEFQNPNDFQRQIREKITQYLIKLKESETKNQENESTKSKLPTESSKTQNNEVKISPFSIEGHGFLKSFLKKTATEDSSEKITPLEVARFRLLSSAISTSGNDVPFLGTHDANIIYQNKQIKYGAQEISRLIDCSLKNISHENVPLWHWYNTYKEDAGEDFITFKSFFCSDEGIIVGALEVMRIIGAMLPIDDKTYSRNLFILNWLSANRSNSIKVAALRYLKYHGKDEDLPLIQSELDHANSNTARIALEAILSIQLRYNKSKALKTIFINQFELFDEALLDEVLSVPSNLEVDILKLGLKHRNERIRLESFKRLKKEKKISKEELQELKNDSFIEIRKEVVCFMILSNQTISDREVHNILIKPQKRRNFGGLLDDTYQDDNGLEYFDEFLFSKYYDMPENKLLEKLKETNYSPFFDENPYFALCSRYFKNHSELLREDIDDQFKRKFEDFVEYGKNIGASNEQIEQFRSLEDFLKKKLIRKGVDILCKKGEANDLIRIRKNMRSKDIRSSRHEIEYMRKLGEWEDIPWIINAEEGYSLRRTSSIFSTYDNWHRCIAESIYNIGKDRLEELLEMEMAPRILENLIKICSISRFSQLSDKVY